MTKRERMKKDLPKWLLYSALFVLYLLHNDLWFSNDATLIFGVPIGLFYHAVFCIAASLLFIVTVKKFWPAELEVEPKNEDRQQ